MLPPPSLISRASFCGYATACLSSWISPTVAPPAPQNPHPTTLPRSLASSLYFHTNVRNAAAMNLSPPLTGEEREKMTALAAKIIRERTMTLLRDDPTLAGPLLRLAFHDAATREISTAGAIGQRRRRFRKEEKDETLATGGPNGSVRYELDWSENRGLSRPLAAVEDAHSRASGLGLSFADAVALAGAATVESAGGPRIHVLLGRPDAAGPDPRLRRRPLRAETGRSVVETTLPSAGLDSDGLRLYFGGKGGLGLSEEEWVALCGAHDLGRHVTLLGMDKACLKNLTRECLEGAPVLAPFVTENPDTLSNAYFRKLLRWYDRKVELGEVAFIPTDVNLVVDEGLREYVRKFADDQDAFFRAFSAAYGKLVDTTATSTERY